MGGSNILSCMVTGPQKVGWRWFATKYMISRSPSDIISFWNIALGRTPPKYAAAPPPTAQSPKRDSALASRAATSLMVGGLAYSRGGPCEYASSDNIHLLISGSEPETFPPGFYLNRPIAGRYIRKFTGLGGARISAPHIRGDPSGESLFPIFLYGFRTPIFGGIL